MSFFRKYKTYIVYAAITLGLGVLSALLTGSYSIYDNFVKPALAPPAIIFPIVWTILYILIGFAAGNVAESNDLDKQTAIKLYFLQLLINVIWPIIFFKAEAIKFALFWLLLLIIVAGLTLKYFFSIRKKAGFLFLPYFLWLLFAFYLNFSLVALNS